MVKVKLQQKADVFETMQYLMKTADFLGADITSEDGEKSIGIDEYGYIEFENVKINDTFLIEKEVEVTQHTVLDNIVYTYEDYETEKIHTSVDKNKSIQKLIDESHSFDWELKHVYVLENDGGSNVLQKLVYKDGKVLK